MLKLFSRRCHGEERGSAYISVIVIVALLFIWMTFQLEQLVQNQQTIAYDRGIMQAQYLAESGIEEMRWRLREGEEIEEALEIHLQSGTAEVEVLSASPLRIRSVGRVKPDIQQIITVELDPETWQIISWSR